MVIRNPTHGPLRIHATGRAVTHVTIMDMQGRVVERCAHVDIRTIDLGHLSTGSYVARISGPDFQTVKRFAIAPMQ